LQSKVRVVESHGADYLGLLREPAVDPPLFVFGSVAEAVLLDGELGATHGDIDLLGWP
jgi:hypothetical protein